MRVVAEHISMRFNDAGRIVEVFDDISLNIASGSSVAIVGESGVGKTTLLHILGALERPVSGTIRIGESSLEELLTTGGDIAAFRGANIGLIFQFHHLLPEFDARENVAMPLIIQGRPAAETWARAEELLKRVGLGHRMTHRPGALSGGEQQRVAIARAFAARPGVILADEPTGNLDVKTAADVNRMLKEMQHEEGITLVVVTHSLELAKSMDRIVELTPHGLEERVGL